MGKSLRIGLAVLLLVSTAGAMAAPSAGAWSWDPKVTLQGTSTCAGRGSTWVWVEGSNGERGWATNGTGRYRFNFTRVPAGGITVRVNYGNSTFKCTASFGLKRPATGTTATRNVYSLLPNG
jgi:hypothetical protein